MTTRWANSMLAIPALCAISVRAEMATYNSQLALSGRNGSSVMSSSSSSCVVVVVLVVVVVVVAGLVAVE
ncbi:hypothetical protein ElyMa_002092100 [Elysia marginata]|uniref:Secreted peptide n=1 Tax=Elysia marginata TaxID=1093978 RepID=A0AAV4FD86_9GAST|nr:hypothetical protein ElyMa_002092100 [Elysia marginata]